MKDHDTTYICLECGFHGTADEFGRHEISAGYDHGTDNYAIAEVELQCECGQTEEEGIVEARYCEFCETWQPEESVHKLPEDKSVGICTKCRTAKAIMEGK
jgi:hypothetical protein